jgi:cytochrome c-type biogenesis protein
MEITLIGAFVAGLFSFVSPCVLPLLPGYLSLMSGYSVADLQDNSASWKRMLGVTSLFVLGFTLVFVALGAGATSIGGWLQRNSVGLSKVAGWMVLAFGILIVLTALQKGGKLTSWMMRERRMHVNTGKMGLLGPPIMGVAFGFAWTPCIGPILGGILLVASAQETVAQGMVLLLVYAMGLGIPFIIAGVGMSATFKAMTFMRKYLRPINVASGVLLVAFGVVMITGNLTRISSWMLDVFGDTPIGDFINEST